MNIYLPPSLKGLDLKSILKYLMKERTLIGFEAMGSTIL